MSDAQIFQVFSLVYLSIGVGLLLNPAFYKKMFEEFIDRPGMLYLGGVMALVVGYLLVAFHNTWTADLSVIITVFGWMALVKGVLILAWPKQMIALTKAILEKKNFLKIEAIIVLIIGVVFAGLGFCPLSPVF